MCFVFHSQEFDYVMTFEYLKSHNLVISRMKRVHSVNLGTDPSLANHNPAISSVPPGTGKLIKFTKADKKP